MRTNEPKTKLLALLRALSPEQREQLAQDCETRVSYLYSLAGCIRKQCKADKAAKIEAATRKMNQRTKGKTPVITVTELGTMCQCAE
jgi:hypothetical protein